MLLRGIRPLLRAIGLINLSGLRPTRELSQTCESNLKIGFTLV